MANPRKMLKLKPAGFQFIQEIPVQAPPARVWAALLNIGGWFYFDKEFSREKSKVTLEPKIGGRVMWEARDGSVAMLQGFVAHMEPHKLLRINGPMGMTHLPVNNAFIWELQSKNGGKTTLLRFCQRTFGFITPQLKKDFHGGWKRLLPQLKKLAETKSKR